MSRRVVLVDLYWTRDQDPRVPLGHASLLAALRKRTSADVRSVVFAVNDDIDAEGVASRVLDEARGMRGDAVDVALGVYVWAEDRVQELLRALRARGFDGRIILGGPQISYTGPGIDKMYPDADIFVRGYGEDALCGLAESPGTPRVPGVHYAGQIDTALQTSVDLTALPSPWLTGVVPLLGQRFIRWETQRGCQFRCSFCQHREPGARLRRRELNSGRVLEEVDLFCRSGVSDIAVLDPIFNTGPYATEILAHFARRRFAGRLSLQCRAEQIQTPFLDAAQSMRVRLEFGLQTIHEREGRAVKRNNLMRRVEDVLGDVRARGIDHEVSLIFGLPEQTLASFLETVRWCLDRRIPVIRAFPLMLLRGTELEQDRERWALVDDGTAMPTVIASSSFSHSEWRQMERISDALRVTEGRHPAHLGELLKIAHTLAPSPDRWRPARRGGVPRTTSQPTVWP